MSRPFPVVIPRHRAITWLVAVSLLAIPSLSHAQLGGLVRKAKDKVTRSAEEQSGAAATLEGENVAFNTTIVELTPERLDQVMRGLAVGREKVGGTNGRADLVARRDAAANEAGDLATRHGSEIDAHNQKRWAVERCRNDAFEERGKARDKELQQRAMTDPAFLQRVGDLNLRLAEAQAKGDSAGAAKVMGEFQALRGGTKADTVAVDKTCGVLPALHPADARITALQAQVAQLDQQIRDGETAAAAEEAKASGLEPRAYAMARERIEMYLARAKSNSAQRGFTSNELKALLARRAELQKLL